MTCLNVDRLSSMHQMTIVIVFFGMVLIIIYINLFSTDANDLIHIQSHLYQPMKYDNDKIFTPWNRKNHSTPYHPSLIIIGSVNGGTSLLNDLYAFFLKSFYDDSKRTDSFYWTRCIPCDQYPNKNMDFHDWNISNLCSVSHMQNNTKLHLIPAGNNGYCTIEHYMSTIEKYRVSRGKNLFSAERCSGYVYAPYVVKIFGVLFPKTILLYAIREKATQHYSRAKNFHKYHGKFSTDDAYYQSPEYFNEKFNIYWKSIQSDKVQNGLIPLLNNNKQTENIRDDIVRWYLSFGMMEHREASPFQIAFRDQCPYINVLLYMKILSVFNKQYGFDKLRIIQSEWLYQDILRSARFMHCIVSVKDSNSLQEMQQCDRYYIKHIPEIMSMSDIFELSDNTHGKNEEYPYLLSDANVFKKLSTFWEICDKRLFELIAQFPTLTVGTKWDYNLWQKQRQKLTETYAQRRPSAKYQLRYLTLE